MQMKVSCKTVLSLLAVLVMSIGAGVGFFYLLETYAEQDQITLIEARCSSIIRAMSTVELRVVQFQSGLQILFSSQEPSVRSFAKNYAIIKPRNLKVPNKAIIESGNNTDLEVLLFSSYSQAVLFHERTLWEQQTSVLYNKSVQIKSLSGGVAPIMNASTSPNPFHIAAKFVSESPLRDFIIGADSLTALLPSNYDAIVKALTSPTSDVSPIAGAPIVPVSTLGPRGRVQYIFSGTGEKVKGGFNGDRETDLFTGLFITAVDLNSLFAYILIDLNGRDVTDVLYVQLSDVTPGSDVSCGEPCSHMFESSFFFPEMLPGPLSTASTHHGIHWFDRLIDIRCSMKDETGLG